MSTAQRLHCKMVSSLVRELHLQRSGRWNGKKRRRHMAHSHETFRLASRLSRHRDPVTGCFVL